MYQTPHRYYISFRHFLPLFIFIILLLGTGSVLLLTQESQEIRQQAYGGEETSSKAVVKEKPDASIELSPQQSASPIITTPLPDKIGGEVAENSSKPEVKDKPNTSFEPSSQPSSDPIATPPILEKTIAQGEETSSKAVVKEKPDFPTEPSSAPSTEPTTTPPTSEKTIAQGRQYSSTVSPSPSLLPTTLPSPSPVIVVQALPGRIWCETPPNMQLGDVAYGGTCKGGCSLGDENGYGKEKAVSAECGSTGLCCVPDNSQRTVVRGGACQYLSGQSSCESQGCFWNKDQSGFGTCSSQQASVIAIRSYLSDCNQTCTNSIGCDCASSCQVSATTNGGSCGGTQYQPSVTEQVANAVAEPVAEGLVDAWTGIYGEERTADYLRAITNTDGYSLAPTTVNVAGQSINVQSDPFGNYVSACNSGSSWECTSASAYLGGPPVVAGGAIYGAGTVGVAAYTWTGQAVVSYGSVYVAAPVAGAATGAVAVVASNPTVQRGLDLVDDIAQTPIFNTNIGTIANTTTTAVNNFTGAASVALTSTGTGVPTNVITSTNTYISTLVGNVSVIAGSTPISGGQGIVSFSDIDTNVGAFSDLSSFISKVTQQGETSPTNNLGSTNNFWSIVPSTAVGSY